VPRILQYEGISATSRMIRWLTWSSVSHTAWEMDDGRVVEAWHKPNGVRIIDGFDQGHTPGTIVRAYRMPKVLHFHLDLAERYMLDQVGKPYHFNGVFRFLSRRDQKKYDPATFRFADWEPDKWFCSELIFAGLMHGGCRALDRVPPWRVSPGLFNLSPLLVLDEVMEVPSAV